MKLKYIQPKTEVVRTCVETVLYTASVPEGDPASGQICVDSKQGFMGWDNDDSNADNEEQKEVWDKFN
jgi:hypothetical protein